MTAKKRTKKYQGPKYIARNPMETFLGGMSGVHFEHYKTTVRINHASMQAIVQGRADKEHWDVLVGMINMALIMCEQGIGPEYRIELNMAREALLACGVRSVKSDRFVFTGDEMRIMNEALEIHDLQLAASRAIDIDRAAAEVYRRLQHCIDSTSVMAAIREQEEVCA